MAGPAVAAQRQPGDRAAAGGHLGRGGAVAGREWSRPGNRNTWRTSPVTVPAMTGPALDRPVRPVPGARAAAAGSLPVPRGRASRRPMPVRNPAASAAGPGNRAGRGDTLQDAGGPGRGDFLRVTAGDQAAAPRAAGRRPGPGPGPGPGACWPRPSARRRGPQRAPGAWPRSAAPRPPPAWHRRDRSCWCPRPAAAAPGRPARAAHPAPAPRRRRAAEPASAPARRRPPPPGPAPATPPPAPAARPPGTARHLPAPRPAAPGPRRSPPRRASSRAGRSRHHFRHPPLLHSPHQQGRTATGMPDYGAGAATLSGPRHGEARQTGTSS